MFSQIGNLLNNLENIDPLVSGSVTVGTAIMFIYIASKIWDFDGNGYMVFFPGIAGVLVAALGLFITNEALSPQERSKTIARENSKQKTERDTLLLSTHDTNKAKLLEEKIRKSKEIEREIEEYLKKSDNNNNR